MLLNSKEQHIYATLRIASAMCFIGHGAFGIITKPIWCNYFAVFGIGHDRAYQLMPVLGAADVLMGIIMLIYPTRVIALWLVVWGLVTAALRPISGEPFAEFIERAGNFGAPIALLMLTRNGAGSIKDWFKRIEPDFKTDKVTFSYVRSCLRITIFLLFIGHGWLNLIEKKGLLSQYASLGFSNTAMLSRIVGLWEIAAAYIVLIYPIRSILPIFLLWKIASEFFYPHWELFEWIERGGSYGVILALWFATKYNSESNDTILDHHFSRKFLSQQRNLNSDPS